jgi:hypothetical protein
VTESEPANSTRALDRRRGRYRPRSSSPAGSGSFTTGRCPVLDAVDVGVLERTILFLAAITSLPAATGILFRFGDVPGAVTLAAVVLAVTTALSARLWWYMSSPERGLADVGRDDCHRSMLRSVLVSVVYLLAIPLGYAVPAGAVALSPLVWLVLVAVDPLTARLYDWFGRRRGRAG